MSGLPCPNDFKACQEFLDGKLLCDCCERHEVDKPAEYEPWFGTDQEQATSARKSVTSKICPCDCRHTARAVCRQHPKLVAAYALLELARG